MADAIDRRRSNNVAVFALVFTLLTNIVALVWGAATLNATVGHLTNTVQGQAVLQAATTAQVNQLNTRMGIVEDRTLRTNDRMDRQ
jgi:hypothetical protein